MERPIDDILNNEAADAPVTDVAEQPEAETEQPETAGPARGPDGKFVKKDETGVENTAEPQVQTEPVPPTEQTNQLPHDVYEPLKAVRNENKELKRQLDAIQRQMSQPAPQPAPPPVDFWEDPQSFMDSRMNQLGQTLLQQWEQRETVKRLDASERAAQSKYADYDEAFVAFEQAVQANPQLAVQLAQTDDPGEFAYRKGKTALEIQRVGSIDELRAQIRSELEAEARATISGTRPVLPSTTAADGSVGARSGPEWAGIKPLGDILK